MRGRTWVRRASVAAGLGLFACSSAPGITDGSLTFTVAESLLEVASDNPTLGAVVLAGETGNCALLQAGYGFDNLPARQFLTFPLEQLNSAGVASALTAGTYTVIQTASYSGPYPASIALAIVQQTDLTCTSSNEGANSGTVTVSPLDTADRGASDVSFDIIFGNSRVRGAYPLSTCLVLSTTPLPDGGACRIGP